MARNTDRAGLRIVSASSDTIDRYAPCRVLGHEWHHLGRADAGDHSPRNGYGAFGWVSSCAHCGMRRVRWYTDSGALAGAPAYERPPDYSLHGDDRLSLGEWRGQWAARVNGAQPVGRQLDPERPRITAAQRQSISSRVLVELKGAPAGMTRGLLAVKLHLPERRVGDALVRLRNDGAVTMTGRGNERTWHAIRKGRSGSASAASA
jgi:hypothetical protein